MEEEMSFDKPAQQVPEPARKKFSRLKRAQPVTKPDSTARQDPSTLHMMTTQALSDTTNIEAKSAQPLIRLDAPSQARSQPLADRSASSSLRKSPTQASPLSAVQAASLMSDEGKDEQQQAQDDQDTQASPSATANDYWDSEDELEAELTRREKAEGFHAESAMSPGQVRLLKLHWQGVSSCLHVHSTESTSPQKPKPQTMAATVKQTHTQIVAAQMVLKSSTPRHNEFCEVL